jgi:general secretion pathway protein B
MSYILDALRRADAERERERGRVPSLNSPTLASAPERPPKGRARRPAIKVAAGLVGLALASALAWWAWPTSTPAPTAPTAATKVPPAPAAPATAPSNAPAPVAQIQPSPAPATAPVVPLLTPAPPPPATKPAVPTAEVSPPAPAKAAAAPSNGKTGSSANNAKGAETTEALPRLADLPADLRAQMPALNLSGATYAENPALRMLIANGKVVQEGQEAAPGVVLEAIGPRSAVLNHRGTRFRVPY